MDSNWSLAICLSVCLLDWDQKTIPTSSGCLPDIQMKQFALSGRGGGWAGTENMLAQALPQFTVFCLSQKY